MYNREQAKYFIRDLGSAGGTFYRILTGQRKELHPGTVDQILEVWRCMIILVVSGMMILLGKHQFNVSSISDVPYGSDTNSSPRVSSTPNVLKGLVSDAEKLVADFERVRLDSKGDNDIEKRWDAECPIDIAAFHPCCIFAGCEN